jgi:hypothetical protein
MYAEGNFGGIAVAMFLFNKNADKPVVKKDTVIFDYLRKMEKSLDDYRALYLETGRLENRNMRAVQRQSLIETFETVIKKSGGELFALPNDDVVVFFNRTAQEEILTCLVKLRFILHDDPLIRNNPDLEKSGFARFYDLSNGAARFRDIIRKATENGSADTKPEERSGRPSMLGQGGIYGGGVRKLRRQLTPQMLGKLQKVLSMADFSSLIRRQSVCAVIGRSAPQMLFDEVFVSIADLRDTLLPDVDLTANPWLFQYLTETLDKRVLASVSKHDDGSLINNFSMNLNVSTILSDEFLQFDEDINASMRSTIVLELQLADIFSDIKAFILAKTFAQYRGYKVCIDGITVDKLKYIDREQLGADLIKIIWHPTFMDVINEDKHFTDYVNKAERAKMIICRVDDPQAVEVGNSLGINLYQGRYIQRLLSAQPRKTIFTIKK